MEKKENNNPSKAIQDGGYEVVGVVPGRINTVAHGLVDLRNVGPEMAAVLAEDEKFRYLRKKSDTKAK